MHEDGERYRKPPADEREVEALERQLGRGLPRAYREFLRRSNGVTCDGCLVLYAACEVPERNTTFSVREFFPGALAVGDDSGGRLILIHFDDPSASPSIVGAGALPEDARALAGSWQEWEQADLPL